jgi:cytochrome c oxidase subunit 2
VGERRGHIRQIWPGWRGPARGGLALFGLALLASGCGAQSPLDPESEPARKIADLWWWMLAASGVVVLGALVLLLWSWRRRSKEGLPLLGKDERASTGMVVTFGVIIPILSLVALFIVSDVIVIRHTEAPAKASTQMTIEVTARQWFWEVRYPGTTAVTANEIHIPARARVNAVVRTADVIHSFWVPQLNRKVDAVPGHPNRILLYADKPGRYRGDCAEFCGAQHSHMGLYVYADEPGRFRAWLAAQAQPAREPTSAEERSGRSVFLSEQCASCHTIRGTPARGGIGPDLTHLKSRSTIGALTYPNRKGYLAGWVLDPQHAKPGNKMPGLNLSAQDFQVLFTYLQSLR